MDGPSSKAEVVNTYSRSLEESSINVATGMGLRLVARRYPRNSLFYLLIPIEKQ